jgi:hypothetical protein
MYLRDVLDALDAERAALEAAYQASDRYTADALQWAADHGHTDSRVVAVAEAAYLDSPQYRTVIEDSLDGEVRW